jgi:hypothetical protein
MKAVLLILSIGLTVCFGQAPEPKTINGGVINGKAETLTRPPFPAAARAVRACGAVNVQVTIDVSGAVTDATAASGHPLLRSASVKAALESRFKPTMLAGTPVRVNGIIVYNFTCPISVEEIGYFLGRAATASEFPADFPASRILSAIGSDWTAERESLEKISAYIAFRESERRRQASVTRQDSEDQERKATSNRAKFDINLSASRTDGQIILIDPAAFDPAAAAEELIEDLSDRISGDGDGSWMFKLAVLAGRVAGVAADELKFISAVDDFARHLDAAPEDTVRGTLERAADLLRAARELPPGVERTKAVANLAQRLFR